jgi:hypothetical protein
MNTRPSYLLTACGVFAIIAALQVVTSWIWLDFTSQDWKVAWCSHASPLLHWILMYAWATSGLAVAYFLLRGLRLEGYAATIVSYAWFWVTVFCVNRDHPNWGQDSLILLIFGAFMLWSYRRYQNRLSSTSQMGNRRAEQGAS